MLAWIAITPPRSTSPSSLSNCCVVAHGPLCSLVKVPLPLLLLLLLLLLLVLLLQPQLLRHQSLRPVCDVLVMVSVRQLLSVFAVAVPLLLVQHCLLLLLTPPFIFALSLWQSDTAEASEERPKRKTTTQTRAAASAETELFSAAAAAAVSSSSAGMFDWTQAVHTCCRCFGLLSRLFL
jgi:hypothetical protein